MKRIALMMMASLFAFSLTACAGTYVMTTEDGQTIVTKGKPTVDDETGMISYKSNGVQQQINRNNVKGIVEQP